MVLVLNHLFVSDHHFCLALSRRSVVVGLRSGLFSFLRFWAGPIRLCLTIAGKKKKKEKGKMTNVLNAFADDGRPKPEEAQLKL